MKRSANAPGPEPIFSAATPKSPPPGTACREVTLLVFDLFDTTSARAT